MYWLKRTGSRACAAGLQITAATFYISLFNQGRRRRGAGACAPPPPLSKGGVGHKWVLAPPPPPPLPPFGQTKCSNFAIFLFFVAKNAKFSWLASLANFTLSILLSLS